MAKAPWGGTFSPLLPSVAGGVGLIVISPKVFLTPRRSLGSGVVRFALCVVCVDAACVGVVRRTNLESLRPVMAQTNAALATLIGFLSVVEHAEHGLFGGYLVLNANGRPLEFHCTAPLKANRAQEILYGPTLKPFLYGEQIGQALVKKSQLEPQLIATDCEAALAVREFCSIPVVLILKPDVSSVSESLLRFKLGATEVAIPGLFSGDRELILRRWQTQMPSADFTEPFSRIHEAIEEAQRNVRSTSAA